jgi:cysteinyl-tRNA synthetase
MSDDFNTAKTLAVLFEMASRINDFKSGNLKLSDVSENVFAEFKNVYSGFMLDVLGLVEESGQNTELLNDVVNVLIELRKKARVDRNYSLSDKIRDKQVGVQLMDGKNGEMTYTIDN